MVVSKVRIFLPLFVAMILLDTLTAYNLFGIPLPWFAYVTAGFGLMVFATTGYPGTIAISWPPGIWILCVLIVLAYIFTFLPVILGVDIYEPPMMPSSYLVFIATRFVVLFGFLIVYVFTFNLALRVGSDKLVNILVSIAILVCLLAIYIYFAQINGWWEPARNRLGTAGQDYLTQSVAFNYAFHRALGTFREPSHLAEWVVVPLLLLMFRQNISSRIYLLIISSICLAALVLTGSLLGYLMLIVAIIFLSMFGAIKLSKDLTIFIVTISLTALMLALFQGVSLLEPVIDRFISLSEGGVQASNRGYVYRYLLDSPPDLIVGYGIGNANLYFAEYMNSLFVQSHLNIFVNYLYSLGAAGFLLISWFFLSPLLFVGNLLLFKVDKVYLALAACLVALLVSYLGRAEELSLISAVVLALFFARRFECLALMRTR